MDFFEVVYNRRSVRQFRSDPVDKEVVLKILDAANWAPTGMRMQQWEFIVVTGEKKQQLGDSYGIIGEAYAKDWDQASRDAFVEYARTYGGAPMIVVVLTEASDISPIRKMHLESASAAMENLVLAARALELGTCWMTGPLQDNETIRNILDIPMDKEIVA
ncbi:MAG: nitroreductase family protein, partial [Methylocystaceae bacterium]